MADFDANNYFARKIQEQDNFLKSKIQQLDEANSRKITELTRISSENAEFNRQYREANKDSWASQMDLDPEGFAGTTVNLGASVVSGASRMGGQLAALPTDLIAADANQGVTQQEIDAYNNYVQGVASADDMAVLNSKRAPSKQMNRGQQNDLRYAPTVLERFQTADNARQTGMDITNRFNLEGIVHQGRRQQLNQDLSEGFQEGSEAIKAGKVLSGLGTLVSTAGKAAVNNPLAAAEYAVENAPQLLVGVWGKAGQVLMGASNIGYATETFRKGMTEYQKRNNGRLPSAEEQTTMATEAASLAAAEEFSDVVGVGLGKAVKGARKGIEAAADDVIRTGFKESLKNIGKASTGAFTSEFGTEGYQTAMEEKIIKGEYASPEEIFKAAVIGGLSGTQLTGGMRTLAEMTGATEQQVKKAEQDERVQVEKAVARVEAKTTGNVDAFLDPANPTQYSPSQAIASLIGHNQQQDVTPEQREANITKAHEIVTGLQERRDALADDLDLLTPEGVASQIARYEGMLAQTDPQDTERVQMIQDEIADLTADRERLSSGPIDKKSIKSLQDQLKKIDFELTETRKNKDALVTQVRPKQMTEAQVAEDLMQASTGNQEAVQRLMVLSMASPDTLSFEQANQLASNEKNGLTAAQREHFRVVSAAREAENRLKSSGNVSQDIYFGSQIPGRIQYQGIKQYNEMMAEAVQTGNRKLAERALGGLTSFARNHADKVATAQLAKATVSGRPAQILFNKTTRKWEIADRKFSENDIRKLAGLTLNSPKLMNEMAMEAEALNKAAAALRSSYTIQFTQQTGVNSVSTVDSQTAPSVEASPVKTSTQSVQSTSVGPNQYKGADSTQVQAIESTPESEERPEASDYETEITQAAEELGITGESFADTETQLFRTLMEQLGIVSIDEAVVDGLIEDAAQEYEDDPDAFRREATYQIQEYLNEQVTETEEPSRYQPEEASEGDARSDDEPITGDAPVESTTESEDGTEVEEVGTGELSVFAKTTDWAGKKLGEVYQQLNLVAEFLVQKASKPTDKTKRPLVAIPDFLSAWNKDPQAFQNFLAEKDLDIDQKALLEDFREKANAWLPEITQNLITGQFYLGQYRKDKQGKAYITEKKGHHPEMEYRYKDPLQFLVEGNWKNFSTDENVKTAIAYAAYSWVAENAGNPQLTTREGVKAMFGVPEYLGISEELYMALRDVGSRDKVVINSLGQRIVQALGLSATDQAMQDLLPKLQSSLGAHAAKLLLDQGILKHTEIKGAVIKEGLPKNYQQAADEAIHGFLAFTRTEGETFRERQLKPVAQGIKEKIKGTRGVLSQLFGTEPELREPSWKPVKFKQKRLKNTDQKVPAYLARMLQGENATAWYVRQDLWGLVRTLDSTTVLDILGYEDVSENVAHTVLQVGRDAKNEGTARNYDRNIEFINTMESKSPLGLDQPVYFNHIPWKQQRVGKDANVLNPQTDKFARLLLAPKEWTTELSSKSTEDMENFFLRVAEGLGIKTDRQENDVSLDEVHALLSPKSEDPRSVALRQAVDALRLTLVKVPTTDMTPELSQAIAAGVKAGGEKAHSLDALLGLARYEQAKRDANGGPFTFTVQMMGEVDGVSNGPILSHLLLGASYSVDELFALINKGGFFRESDGFQNYNVYRGTPGNQDLYETTTKHMMGHMVRMFNGNESMRPVLNSLYAITGRLDTDDGRISKEGRNIIKTPLTAMLFGSDIDRAIESMFEDFVVKLYDHIEAVAKTPLEGQNAARVELIGHINELLAFSTSKTKISTSASVSDLLALDFSKQPSMLSGLQSTFTSTLGEAVKTTMEEDFAAFMDTRKVINTTAGATFELFHAAYQGIRESFIKELIETGEVASTATKEGTPKPLHDLTPEQEARLEERVKAVNPVVHTLMSQLSGKNLEAGLHVSKTGQELSSDPTYRTPVQFGKAFQRERGGFSWMTAAYQSVMQSPGVAMIPMMVHSLDSFISHTAAYKKGVLNVHDAHGTGLKNFTQTAQRLNAATWEGMLNYSPASEMRDAWVRTLEGMGELLRTEKDTQKVKQNLKEAITGLAKKNKMAPAQVLTVLTNQMYQVAYTADQTKLQALMEMAHVDQYALQGGQYDVTEADRAEAAKRLEALVAVAPDTLETLIDQINDAAGYPSTSKETSKTSQKSTSAQSPWGDLRMDATEPGNSVPEIVALFKGRDTVPAQEMFDVVGKLLKQHLTKNEKQHKETAQLYSLILDRLLPRCNPELKFTVLRKDTPEQSVSITQEEKDFLFNSLGWTTLGEGGKTIYLLGTEHAASRMDAQTILHETLHHVLSGILENPKTPEEKALVQDLDLLLKAAQQYVAENGNKITNLAVAKNGTANVHELVSWGMLNPSFQEQVLKQVQVPSTTHNNKLITGMRKFITSIVRCIFPKASTKSQERIENGIETLFRDVSGLLNAKDTERSTKSRPLPMASPDVNSYSTQTLYAGLSGQVSGTFNTHLQGLLQGIVDKLHGPFGAFKEERMAHQALTPSDIFLKAQIEGVAPFASKALVAGFNISEKEAFVLEQLEATVRAALTDNTGQTTVAYRELSKLYQETRQRLKVEDFHQGDWATATPTEKAQAEDMHTFLFKIEKTNGDTSDYLSRFAALGLAHEQINGLLKVATTRDTRTLAQMPLTERLQAIFERVLTWLNGKLTKTYAGQQGDAKLETLVDQLVSIEAKKRAKLLKTESGVLDMVDKSIQGASQGIRKTVGAVADSSLFKQSSSTFRQLVGHMASTVANDRVEHLVTTFEKFRNEHTQEGLDIASATFNEIRGMNDGNKVMTRLFRGAKRREGVREDVESTTTKTILESFANKGKDLDAKTQKALANFFLRTDASCLLDSMELSEIYTLLQNDPAIDKKIADIERQLVPYKQFAHFYSAQAKILGYYMATGEVKGTHLLKNAEAITRMIGTGYQDRLRREHGAETEQNVQKLVDQLITLRTLQYVSPNEKALARNVLATETRRGQDSGIEFLLKYHRQLGVEAKDRLFYGNSLLVIKGYTSEIYNPHKEVRVADESQRDELEAQGFTQGGQVATDKTDPNKTVRHLYYREGGGLAGYMTGAFSLTDLRAKGSRSASDSVETHEDWVANKQDLKVMRLRKTGEVMNLFKPNPGFDPAKVEDTFAAPVLDGEGHITAYNYLMSARMKDSALLDRDNRFATLLGRQAAHQFDKVSTPEQNRKVVQALKDQFDEEVSTRSKEYRVIGPQSTIAAHREIYQMLPDYTKEAIKAIWGDEGMQVRVDLLPIVFGYRKVGFTEVFDKDPQIRSACEQIFVELATQLLGKKAMMHLNRADEIWQLIIKEVKDIYVIKNLSTLVGNIRSNVSELIWFGVPVTDIVRDHRIALKGATAYRKDSEALAALRMKLESGYTQGQGNEIKREILRLEDALARNPVRELIEAGLMPTIVEDLDQEDIYSYKSRAQKQVERVTSKINPHVKNAAKFVYMTHDTPLYKALHTTTQLSDFVARYTLYQHLTTSKDSPMGKAEALDTVEEAFVNYDRPTHRWLAAANDHGLVMFTKYYLRIQKVIAKLFHDKPGRGLALVTLSKYFNDSQVLSNSSALHRLGNNPLTSGVFQYPEALDELLPIKIGMALFD